MESTVLSQFTTFTSTFWAEDRWRGHQDNRFIRVIMFLLVFSVPSHFQAAFMHLIPQAWHNIWWVFFIQAYIFLKTSPHRTWLVNMLILNKDFMLDMASNKGTISNMESLKIWFGSLIWVFSADKTTASYTIQPWAQSREQEGFLEVWFPSEKTDFTLCLCTCKIMSRF